MATPRIRRLELTGAVLAGAVNANIIANLRIGAASSINLGTLTSLAKSAHTPSYIDVVASTVETE